jgi:hypothetical protein
VEQQLNCDNCYALWYCYFVDCGCLLNYKNEKQGEKYTPLEPCPKPLTRKEFEKLKGGK